MTSLAELRAKPHTSISQIKTFLMCPRRYYFQYVLRVAPAFRALALVFGTAWHETIGEHLLRSRPDQPVPLDELRDHLRDGIVHGIEADGAPVLFEEEEQDSDAVVAVALKMLDVFVARVPLPEKLLGVEVAFSMDLAHPNTGELLPLPLIGAMDAVVVEQGNTTVWELKSGKRRWGADQLDFDIQMTAYKMAARELGHGDVDLKLLVTTKGKTADVQVERLVRHEQDERELAEVAFGVHAAVRAGVDHPIRGWQCRTCPYAGSCSS